MENKPIVVLSTTPDLKCAKEIAHLLVQKKKAACCNIIPNIISVYEWDSKINEDNEYLLIIKSTSGKYKDLEQLIISNHPYDLPEIISVDIEKGYPAYMNWIIESTR